MRLEQQQAVREMLAVDASNAINYSHKLASFSTQRTAE